MPNYILSQTASEINNALQKVVTPDTEPQSTDNLVTSRGVKTYVDDLRNYVDLFKPNIVQAVKQSTFTQTNPYDNWFDIPGLSVSITPKFSNSKMLVQAMVSSSTNSAYYGVHFKLVRDTTDIAMGDTDGITTRCSFVGGYPTAYSPSTNGIDFLDTPSLVAGTPVNYKVQCSSNSTITIFINRSNGNNNGDYLSRPISTLTVTEIYQ